MEAKDGTTHGREVEVNVGNKAAVGGDGQGGSGIDLRPGALSRVGNEIRRN